MADASLTFRRPRRWPDRFRGYWIEVDAERAGRVYVDADLVVQVPAGGHTLTACIDWCGGNTLTLVAEPGGSYVFEVTNRYTPWAALLAITLFARRYLEIRQIV
jgi:hypothetical protein